jgi:hypothetical protein
MDLKMRRLLDFSPLFTGRREISPVMAGLVPAIHVLGNRKKKDVDARDKPGHDGN